MSLETVDLVRSLMPEEELYSPADLSDIMKEQTDIVLRILEFLAMYKLIGRMTERELIFRKIPAGPSPAEAATILRILREDPALIKASHVPNAFKWNCSKERSPSRFPIGARLLQTNK